MHRSDIARLDELLSQALALADTLDVPVAAIHIDQAIAQLRNIPLSEKSPVVPVPSGPR